MVQLNEFQIFLLFFLEGVIISFIYDIFRSIRRNFKTGKILTFVEDIIFLTIFSIIFIISIIYYCNGEIRFFIFFALFLGIIIYFLTIGKKCVIILSSIVKLCKSFFTFILKIAKKLGNLFNI